MISRYEKVAFIVSSTNKRRSSDEKKYMETINSSFMYGYFAYEFV